MNINTFNYPGCPNLVKERDLKSLGVSLAGSSPAPGTINKQTISIGINMSTQKKFVFYWLHGKTTILTGESVEQAFTNGGYGSGAVKGVDFWDVWDEEKSYSHEWNISTREWIPKK